jgi:hypothetical protein
MTIFAYQVYLAFNGRDPMAVYNFLPAYLVADVTNLVRTFPV